MAVDSGMSHGAGLIFYLWPCWWILSKNLISTFSILMALPFSDYFVIEERTKWVKLMFLRLCYHRLTHCCPILHRYSKFSLARENQLRERVTSSLCFCGTLQGEFLQLLVSSKIWVRSHFAHLFAKRQNLRSIGVTGTAGSLRLFPVLTT